MSNPAWKKLLDLIPAELHSQVEPVLTEWDQGVNAQFTKYAPYKALVDNQADPQFVADALRFASDFEKDPAAFMDRVNKQLNLGFVSEEEAHRQDPVDDGSSLFGDDRSAILESPEFKEMRAAVLAMQSEKQREQEEREEQEALEAFENDMESFLNSKVDSNNNPLAVNKLFFGSLRASGLSNEAAWDQYQRTVAEMLGKEYVPGEQVTPSGSTQAPAIMGSDGNVGSGQPTEKIEFGSLKNNDLDDLVIQMLQQQGGN